MFSSNVAKEVEKNTNYRKVIHTTGNVQLVYMNIDIGEDIPLERHDGTQIFNIISGNGVLKSGNKKKILRSGVVAIVPPFVNHYLKNTSNTVPLKLFTIYTPPEHPKNTIHRTQRQNLE